ncbi:MAG: prepilin-type N-terminal cleavage/methylation domain-containing protein [Alphaproteobacteria bacterium]|nr:prepilin-type N-terminal cleavage/methylation domain-containing protein [Alphaproteobacteria bacterium]
MGHKHMISGQISKTTNCRLTPAKSKGFTLIELSIVITIIGLLFAGAMVGVPMFINNQKQQETTERIDTVMNALSSYVQRHNRLPCPADPEAETPANPGEVRGTERNGGVCFDGADTAAMMRNVEGLVPWRELGISERDAIDAWGKYLTYRPAPNLTVNNFAASMQEDKGVADAQIHNACRSPIWYNKEGKHLDRAKALFVCNAQPTTAYLTDTGSNAAFASIAGVEAWREVALGAAGTDAGGTNDVLAANSWVDKYTDKTLGGDLMFAGAFNQQLTGRQADAPLARATGNAVTIISHGANNMFSFLRDGSSQNEAASGYSEERKNFSDTGYMGNIASPKSAVKRGGNVMSAGSGATGKALDDIVVALRSDQLYSKIGGPTVSATRPQSSAGENSQPEAPLPSDCSAGISITWTDNGTGYTCSGSLGSNLTHGNSGSVTDGDSSNGDYAGSASVTCNNGSLTVNSSDCDIVITKCPAEARSWTVGGFTCNGNISETDIGDSSTATDAAAPETGSSTYTCQSDGTWSQNAGSTCNPGNCSTGGSRSWSDGGFTCTGAVPATINHGNSATATDSTLNEIGSATYSCNNGVLTANAGYTCEQHIPCAATTLNWTVAGITCSVAVGLTNDGVSTTLTDSTVPTTGSSSATCTNGSWNVASGGTCISQCPASTAVSWVDTSITPNRTCNGTTVATAQNAGTSLPITDATGPDVGTGTAVCAANGTWSATGSCTRQCTGSQAVSWTISGKTCNGTTAAAAVNNGVATATVVDSTGVDVGSASFTCNNGTLSVNPDAICSSGCTGGPVAWVIGGNTCDGTIANTAANQNANVTDSIAPTTGSATFQCVNECFKLISGTCDAAVNGGCASYASNYGSQPATNTGTGCSAGTYDNSTPADTASQWRWSCNGSGGGTNATCTANKAQCSGAVSWTVGGKTCTGTAAATNSGSNTATITDSTATTTGSATFACANGTLTVNAGATCVESCTAQAVSWSVSGSTCNQSAPATANGANTATLTDSTLPTTGSASYYCNNGTLSVNGGASCVTAVNGACTAYGATYGSQPGTSTANACSAGTYTDLADDSTNWRWRCDGVNGGTNSGTCTASKSACSGAVSWTVSGQTCSGTAASTASGGNTASINNTAAGKTGAATFACDNGSLTVNAGATCAASCTVSSYTPAQNTYCYCDEYEATTNCGTTVWVYGTKAGAVCVNYCDGGGGGGGCFAAGTMIKLADGSDKPIEQIKEGDAVLSFDMNDPQGALVANKVAATVSFEDKHVIRINDIFTVTADHKFPLPGKMNAIEAGDLKVGDTLIAEDGSLLEVKTIETLPDTQRVYNFEVENNHNYIANGVRTNNMILTPEGKAEAQKNPLLRKVAKFGSM